MSPLEIRSTYSAATFSGPITASSVSFTPSHDLPEVALVLRGVGPRRQLALHRRLRQHCRVGHHGVDRSRHVPTAAVSRTNACFTLAVSASPSPTDNAKSIFPWANASSPERSFATSWSWKVLTLSATRIVCLIAVWSVTISSAPMTFPSRLLTGKAE